MALVTCPQCAKSISSFALACPGCGREQGPGKAQAYPWPAGTVNERPVAHKAQAGELFRQNLQRLHALFDSRLGPFAAETAVTSQYVHAWMTIVRSYFAWDSAELQRQIAEFLAARRTIGLAPNEITHQFHKLALRAVKTDVSRVELQLAVILVRARTGTERSLVLELLDYAEVSSRVRQILTKNGGQYELVVYQKQ